MRHILLGCLLGSLLTVSAAGAGQLWTATGSTGTIDPAVLSISSLGVGCVGYSTSTSSTTPITVRYNVTLDDTTSPTWKTIEILANNANLTNGAVASLYSVNRTTGAQTYVAGVPSTASSSTQAYTFSIGTSVTFDLTSYYYVIEAELSRTSSSAYPTICGLRLY